MTLSVFLDSQLDHVIAEVEREVFPDRLLASGAAVEVDTTTVPNGAKTYSYRKITHAGAAAILASGADDIPVINMFAESRFGEIKTISLKYVVEVDEVEYAQYANIPLAVEAGLACRERIEADLDRILYTGSPENNLIGLLDLPGVTIDTFPNDGNENGGVNSSLWIHKTPAQIYRDLSSFVNATPEETENTYYGQILGLPVREFNRIMTTPYTEVNSTTGETILSFFLKTQSMSPLGIKRVIPMPYLAGASNGLNQMIMFRREGKAIKSILPLDIDQRKPTTEIDLKYEVVMRLKTGGIMNRQPLSVRYAIGF